MEFIALRYQNESSSQRLISESTSHHGYKFICYQAINNLQLIFLEESFMIALQLFPRGFHALFCCSQQQGAFQFSPKCSGWIWSVPLPGLHRCLGWREQGKLQLCWKPEEWNSPSCWMRGARCWMASLQGWRSQWLCKSDHQNVIHFQSLISDKWHCWCHSYRMISGRVAVLVLLELQQWHKVQGRDLQPLPAVHHRHADRGTTFHWAF